MRILFLLSAIFMCSACTHRVRVELVSHQVMTVSDLPPATPAELLSTATWADGLVQLRFKFPRALRGGDLGNSPEWMGSISSVTLADCRNSDLSADQSWGTELENVILVPPEGMDVIDFYLPRNLGKLVRRPVLMRNATWPDQAIRDNELCLYAWNAAMFWKRFEIAPVKLGTATGFLTEPD